MAEKKQHNQCIIAVTSFPKINIYITYPAMFLPDSIDHIASDLSVVA